MSTVSIIEFQKALESLKEAYSFYDLETDLQKKTLFRDATIQRFEFTVELAWKISIKILGHSPTSPKQAIRDMARSALIDDTQVWFDFIEAHNKTSHSYDEDVALEIINKIKKFIPHSEELLKKLNSK